MSRRWPPFAENSWKHRALKSSNATTGKPNHSLAEVEISGLRLEQNSQRAWQPAYGKIMVATPEALATNFFAGQNVEVSGVIGYPPPPPAEGLFDYRAYLKTRGIYFELKVESANDWQLSAPGLDFPVAGRPFFELVPAHARAGFAGGRRTPTVTVGHDPRLAHSLHR